MKRVTDLEKFALEEVWRPYQNMMGYEKRLERLPVGLEETARLLQTDTTGWSKRVIDRIKNIGVTFPDYIQHPLVDVIGGGTKSDGGVEGHVTNGAPSKRIAPVDRPDRGAGIKPGPSDPAQEPEAVAPKPDRQHWAVEIRENGETVLTIESNCLSGKEDVDTELVRNCAHHLLGFIGASATVSLDRETVADDVVRLVNAARLVAFTDQGPEAIKQLDDASEAFADRVPWDDEPEEDLALIGGRM